MIDCPIFICGLPGSGKSHFGKLLAESLGIAFTDLDERITQTHDSPGAIIRDRGEFEFRKMESDVLQHWVKTENGLLSLGGGTPCFFNHMEWLTQVGVVIFLNEDLDVIMDRLTTKSKNRPLVEGNSEVETRLKLRSLLQKRIRFYNLSQIISGSKPAQTLDLYTNRLKLLTKM